MKKISIYRPTTVDEAIQILSQHGTEAGVYAGGTDLLIRLKNRLKQAPTYLVDIKKIDNLRYIKEDAQGRRADRRGNQAGRDRGLRSVEEALPDAGAGRQHDLVAGAAQCIDARR